MAYHSTPPSTPSRLKDNSRFNKLKLPLTPITPTMTDNSSASSSPYTPFSMKSSVFTTPESSAVYSTPESVKKRSLADLAENWRMRDAKSVGREKMEMKSYGLLSPFTSQSPSRRFIPSQPLIVTSPTSDDNINNSLFISRNRSPLFSSPSFDLFTDSPLLQPLSSIPSPTSAPTAIATPALPPTSTSTTSCLACNSPSSRFAILIPCSHRICSSCLTSSLNIVGEKEFACMLCHGHVSNFTISSTSTASTTSTSTPAPTLDTRTDKRTSTSTVVDVEGLSDMFAETSIRSTSSQPKSDYAVLRIDNVPWDVTPPSIRTFFALPTHSVHILLDRKTGKTLSHAYVEASFENARIALKECRNKVLGSGKRARPVTVTMSSQAELMRELFPTWKGNFEGSLPTVSGLNNSSIVSAINTGLLSFAELDSLLHLVETPDSHFLKVPTLPFYALISILLKFPAERDSRVFWSNAIRDQIFVVTHAALQTLISRSDRPDFDSELYSELVRAAITCQAFTEVQINTLSHCTSPGTSSPSTLDSPSLPDIESDLSAHAKVYTASSPVFQSHSPFDKLAADFGVETHVVQALCERLSSL